MKILLVAATQPEIQPLIDFLEANFNRSAEGYFKTSQCENKHFGHRNRHDFYGVRIGADLCCPHL